MAQLISTTVTGDLAVNGNDLVVDRDTGRVAINRLVDTGANFHLDVDGDIRADNLYGNAANVTGVNLADKTTDDLTEGSGNLYYTDARVHAAIAVTGDLTYDDAGTIGFALADHDTGDLAEGTNLYFTDERAQDAALQNVVGGDGVSVSYDAGTNQLTIDASVGSAVTSDDVTEGSTNLYFTDERAQDAAGALATNGTNVSLTYDDAANTLTPELTGFTGFDTGDLTEGTNLYFTDERAQDAVFGATVGGAGVAFTYDDAANTGTFAIDFAEFTTDDLNEGSVNLFFTDTRAVDAIEAAAGLTFTGGLTLGGNLDMGGNDITNIGNVDLGGGTITAARIQSGDTYVDVAGGVVEFGDGGAAVGTVSDSEVSFTHNAVEIDSDNATDHVTLRSEVQGDNTARLYVRNGADNNDADLTVRNLTVNGTTTIVNSEQVSIADNVLVLNSDVSGAPTEDGGVEVERGTETNASLIWDEVDDVWKAGTFGNETQIALTGDNLSSFTNDLALSSFTNDLDSDDIPEGSTNLYFTDARAIAAVEGEATLDLTGDVTVAGTLGVTGAATFTAGLTSNGTVDVNDDVTFNDNTATQRSLAGLYDQVQDIASSGGDFTTDDVTEGSANLFFTDERAQDAVGGILTNSDNISFTYDDVANTITADIIDFTGFDTGDLTEGTNLYYTDGRVHAALSAAGQLAYDGAGEFSFSVIAGDGVGVTDNGDGTITVAATLGSSVTTDDVEEGSANLYFTDERAQDAVGGILTDSATVDFTYDDAAGTITAVLSSLTGFDTDDLAEGSTNLFFTNTRAVDAVEGAAGLTFTGGLTLGGDLNVGGNNITNVGTVDGIDVSDLEGRVTTVEDSLGSITTDDVAEGTTNLFFTDERVDDRVAALIQSTADGTSLTWTYDDAAGTLTPVLDIGNVGADLDDRFVNEGGDTTTGDYDFNDGLFVLNESANTITSDGDVTIAGTLTAGSIVETSTIRLKEQVVSMGSELAKLMQLNPVEFTWKTNKKRDKGLIAEQVQKVYPEFVGRDATGATGINYSKLTSVLIQSVKELNQKVEELESQLRNK